MTGSLSCNSVFNGKRRLLKAFHAFKTDPSLYNFNRIASVVRKAGDSVYVENAINDFAASLCGRDRYASYYHSLEELQSNENAQSR